MSLTDPARCAQLRRIWLLIALLRSRSRWMLADLAGELGVSARTVRRDLCVLQAAGIPLLRVTESDVERGKPWRLMKGAPCPICNRGIATGKEYRETRQPAQADPTALLVLGDARPHP